MELMTVQTPKLCQLIINGNILPLTQVVSYRIEENKKPIYGFNKKDFTTMIRGKTIVSGHIIIKKQMKDIVGRFKNNKDFMVQSTTELVNQKIAYVSRIKNSNVIVNADNKITKKMAFDDWQENIMDTYTKLIEKLKPEDVNNDSFLDMGFDDNVELKINFNILKDNNIDYENSSDILTVTNVHFMSREGEISIAKDSIDEVYTFVGNLGS